MNPAMTTPPSHRPRGSLPALIGRFVLPRETYRVQLELDGQHAAFEAAIAGSERVVVIPAADRNPTGCIGTLAEIVDSRHYADAYSLVEIVGVRRVRVTSMLQRRPFPLVTVRSLRPSNTAVRRDERILALIAWAQENSYRKLDIHEELEHLSPSDQVDRLTCIIDVGSSMKRSAARQSTLEARLQLLERHRAEEDGKTKYGPLKKAVAVEDPDEPELPKAVEAAITREENDGSSFGDRSHTAVRVLRSIRWTPSGATPAIDLKEARRLLDESHAGLDEIKDIVLDHLATIEWRRRQKLPTDGDGLAICLVGPPGTGKTSIATAIAMASHRKLETVPLGGCDDVFLAGSDRAYSGSRPGEIIRRLRNSGRHPSEILMLLDEIDKTSAHPTRNPVPVLLALIDPTQNTQWQDQFLGMVPVDLSGVLFVATANEENDIPLPLRDRMRVIHLPAYSREQQVEIGWTYLLPRLMAKLGVDSQVQVSLEAMVALVVNYPASDGMRQLEQRITSVVARALRRHLETRRPVRIDPAAVAAWIVPPVRTPTIGFKVAPATRAAGSGRCLSPRH